ncbi:hypothetical protein [Vibrio spartinae]|uniref:Uncharacterized protein n=1 Tax=Vibrio spartinae TaxID=1918945 RepID=A0ABX6QWH1_9VIBR|nr:hypothetical protein [Vibrio spartinae]QMV13581.1 hypothetical protein Vspart_00819 [Vibrio spartinae]
MKLKTLAALLCVFIVIVLSGLNAWNLWGDFVEKAISFATTVILFLVVTALFDVWRGGKNFKVNEIKAIAISFPIITVIEYVYPVIKYSEQKHSGWLFSMSMDLMLAFFVSSVLWSYLKKCQYLVE